MKILPPLTQERLIRIERVLYWEELKNNLRVTSAYLGQHLNVPGHTIRKDISHLEAGGQMKQGYEVKWLRKQIRKNLKIDQPIAAAVVGLASLGQALLQTSQWEGNQVEIKAGFEDNINRLETITAPVPLYPEYELADRANSLNLEIALLTVTEAQLELSLERLTKTNIKGIINFTTRILPARYAGKIIKNLNLIAELKLMQSKINQELNKD